MQKDSGLRGPHLSNLVLKWFIRKFPRSAYVIAKKLGISWTTPLKFGFAMLSKKVPTIGAY